MNKCMLCDITTIQGGYDVKCLVCLAYLILEHPKPLRKKLIQHWGQRYGHDEEALKNKVIEIYRRSNTSIRGKKNEL